MKEAFEIWAKEFLKVRNNPMDLELSVVFLVCNFEDGSPDFPPQEIKELFVYQVLAGRVGALGITLSNGALTFIASLIDSPGSAVMYASALRYWAGVNKTFAITMHDLAHIFPMGFPNENELSTLWDAQKGYKIGLPVVNMLDSAELFQKE